MRFPGFIGPSYTLQSVNVDCQRTVNLFPEIDELGTGKEREVAALVPTPGKRLKLTLAGGVTRGGFTASNGTLYAVGGNKLYSVSSAWVATELGTLNTSTGAVSFADNGIHVVVVDGTWGYVFTIASSAFAQITDLDFPGADTVTFQDGYFIFNKPNSGQFLISGLNDVTFDALDIATAEGKPDNVVGVISNLQNVYVFGTQTTEVFYDSGDVFPFSRIQGALIDAGCIAPQSIRLLGNAPVWVGQDENGFGMVYKAQGYQAQRISTPAIEAVIRSLGSTAVAASRAYTYQQGGHQFYCLNISGATSTWVYDASTSFWHERTYLNLWSEERDRADWHALAYGVNIVGDYDNGNVYQLDPDYLSDNGTSIARTRIAPHLSQDMLNQFHSSFELDIETGVGLDGTGQGTDPQVILSWSDDHGHSWSNEKFKSFGKRGERRTRVKWNRLGRTRDRVYKIKVTDPVKVVLLGAEVNVEAGAA
jgi:hypothetical protein